MLLWGLFIIMISYYQKDIEIKWHILNNYYKWMRLIGNVKIKVLIANGMLK